MPPGADVTVAARHPLRTFHRLAQRPHGARHGRTETVRTVSVATQSPYLKPARKHSAVCRTAAAAGTPDFAPESMTDEREETSRKRNMKTDVFIAYGNTRTTNLVQIRKTSKFAAVFFQFISIHFRPEVGRSRSPPPTGHAGQPDGHKKGREIPARKVWTASTCAP